jgi:hypothetical protein
MAAGLRRDLGVCAPQAPPRHRWSTSLATRHVVPHANTLRFGYGLPGRRNVAELTPFCKTTDRSALNSVSVLCGGWRRQVLPTCGVLAVILATAAPAVGVRRGIGRGAPVTVRTNPENAVVAAVRAGASRVHLGPVRAVGFERDCSPSSGHVVVCRDASLMTTDRRATTAVGPEWCVVRLDPRVGGGGPAVRHITQALRRCRR